MAQYSTDKNLAARIALQSHGINPISWPEWYWNQIDLSKTRTILDAGCGNGLLWEEGTSRVEARAEMTLLDQSPGMLSAARERVGRAGGVWQFVEGSVEALPFDDDSFDLVMANHMLYHSSDIPRAIGELARVVRAGGVVAASTNGLGHMRQLREWVSECGMDGAIASTDPGAVCGLSVLRAHVRSFGLENGADLLGANFESVELHRQDDAIEVRDVDLVLNYVRSLELPNTQAVISGMERLRELLHDILEREQVIRIDKDSGVFHCTKPRQA